MSITRILCEKCGFPMAHCSCVTPIERAIDVAFNSVLQMKLSEQGKAKFVEEFTRELEKAVPAKKEIPRQRVSSLSYTDGGVMELVK